MTHVGVSMRRLLVALLAATLLFGLTATVATQSASAAFPGGLGWIAFSGTDPVGLDSEIYALNPGTGDVVNLTDNLFLEADPAFSADGTMLAYAGTDLVGASAIYVAPFNPAGPSLGAATKISNGPIDGSPAWSPDGTMVAFHRRIITEMSSGTATADDATGTVLTDDPGGDFITEGVQSGDTVKNLTDGSQGIVTGRTATTVSITGGLAGGVDNEWAIGDSYTIERSHRQIFKSPVNGSNLAGTLLSQAGSELLYTDQEPVWSPDGALIAFTSTEDASNSDILTMSATDGSSRSNLTDTLTFDNSASHPNWSPDGQSIAFQSAEPNVPDHNIWTMSRTGASPAQVTGAFNTGTDNDLEPAWSPEGTQIIFRRGDTGGNKVYIVGLGGGPASRIGSASEPTANTKPDWQPVLTGVADGPYVVDEGDTLTVAAAQGVLVNDLALVSNVGTLSATSFSDPAHGDLTGNADGSFTYVHDGTDTTSDSFTYVPTQGSATGDATTVTITINPVEDPVEPDPPTVTISGPAFGQIGEQVTFTSAITDGSGPVSYTWTVTREGTAIPPVGTSATYDFTPTLSGIYDVQVAVSDDAGDDTANFKFTIMTDITGNVFASDIVWLANEGITRGCNPPTNDQYCPSAVVSRGQMAAFLVRFLGLTDIDPTIEFTDTGSSIFEEDILRLATAGITRGCNVDGTQYCPNDSVTRGQMAAFLVRALGLTDDGGGDLFEDDDNSIFEGDIDKLATAGITRGCNPPANTNFCPTDTVTRGQMAAFLHRADELR